MSNVNVQHSEVARLLEQIGKEYDAARQGFSGLAQGISQHRFMTKRLENIAKLHMRLHNLVGDDSIDRINLYLDLSQKDESKPTQ